MDTSKNTLRVAGLTILLLLLFGTTLYWMASSGSSGPSKRRKAERNLTELPTNRLRRSPLEPDTVRAEVDVNLAADSLRMTSEELMRLSPEVFDSIKVELEQKFVRNEDGSVSEVAASKRALMVNKFARAQVWLTMTSDAKVDLLFATFNTVMERHPRVEPIVTLIFDDGRPDLQFSFQDVQKLLGARENRSDRAASLLSVIINTAARTNHALAGTPSKIHVPSG